jgi:hypothetical protein
VRFSTFHIARPPARSVARLAPATRRHIGRYLVHIGVDADHVRAAELTVRQLHWLGVDSPEALRSMGMDCMDLRSSRQASDAVCLYGAEKVVREFLRTPADAVSLASQARHREEALFSPLFCSFPPSLSREPLRRVDTIASFSGRIRRVSSVGNRCRRDVAGHGRRHRCCFLRAQTHTPRKNAHGATRSTNEAPLRAVPHARPATPGGLVRVARSTSARSRTSG